MYVYIYIYNEQSCRASHRESGSGGMKRHDHACMNVNKYIFICMYIYTYTMNSHIARHIKKIEI